LFAAAVEKLRAKGLSDEEIRRLFEAELADSRKREHMTDEFVIETSDLRKTFEGVDALAGLTRRYRAIDLRLPRQERRRQDVRRSRCCSA